jgi:hypothetical protein
LCPNSSNENVHQLPLLVFEAVARIILTWPEYNRILLSAHTIHIQHGSLGKQTSHRSNLKELPANKTNLGLSNIPIVFL